LKFDDKGSANREMPLKVGRRPREDARKGKSTAVNNGGDGAASEDLKVLRERS
jgi:hypothetical protein